MVAIRVNWVAYMQTEVPKELIDFLLEHNIHHRTLTHPYKLKASETMYTVHYLQRGEMCLHLGNARTCTEYALNLKDQYA